MISFIRSTIAWSLALTVVLGALNTSDALAEQATMGIATSMDDPISGDHADTIEVNPAGLGFGGSSIVVQLDAFGE